MHNRNLEMLSDDSCILYAAIFHANTYYLRNENKNHQNKHLYFSFFVFWTWSLEDGGYIYGGLWLKFWWARGFQAIYLRKPGAGAHFPHAGEPKEDGEGQVLGRTGAGEERATHGPGCTGPVQAAGACPVSGDYKDSRRNVPSEEHILRTMGRFLDNYDSTEVA